MRLHRQPRQAQFAVYSVPDDAAAAFDCESRDSPIALLWSTEGGCWKIVSWKVRAADARTPAAEPVPDSTILRINSDPRLAQAAQGFLESWLVQKNYDAAFGYVSLSAPEPLHPRWWT